MRLRALAAEDCETLVSWIPSADALFQWSGPWDFRWPLDVAQLQRDLSQAGDHRRVYGAVDMDGELVGHAMLTARLDQGIGAIGRVLIAPDRRGVGLGAALMHELVAVGFDQLGLHRLQLSVYDFNAGAIACYQRAGFVIEGRLRDSTRGTTGYWSGYLMALLEPEYRARVAPGSGRGRVRPARFADAPALARLLTELGYPQDAAQTGAQLTAWAGDPRGIVLVADSDGSPTGFIAAYAIRRMDRSDSFARVVALAVDPGRQRSGLGRRLLAAVEAWAGETGCSEIEITSSRSREGAHAFYRALGFTDLCDRSARFRRPLS